ncbi:MAG: 3-hydroxyacyl-CoA dehydrogenase [Tagaea sp. CACIAM 22H2]|nr:3-hydroxyacyl-CoA dehydrogenase [Tagaea sp. CACIAM 22H2]
MEIENRSALVTGAGSGLGAAVARGLAARGAKVAVIDRDGDKARATSAEIGGLALTADVRREAEIVAALDEIDEAHGTASIVVNCAGIGTAGRIVGREGPLPLDAFARVIDVNLIGTFNVMRLAAARMSTLAPDADGARGAIVNTASVAAYDGQIGQAAYAASKGGIVAMTLPAAREFARFGIRVNTIAPGVFLTPLLAELPEEARHALTADIPFPARLGDPREFAEAVLFCIANRYINGETIRLDGALRMKAK